MVSNLLGILGIGIFTGLEGLLWSWNNFHIPIILQEYFLSFKFLELPTYKLFTCVFFNFHSCNVPFKYFQWHVYPFQFFRWVFLLVLYLCSQFFSLFLFPNHRSSLPSNVLVDLPLRPNWNNFQIFIDILLPHIYFLAHYSFLYLIFLS